MAIKARVSSQGDEFKKYVGVGSFRVLGVNPNKDELEKFYGRTVQSEPEYLKDKVDDKDNNKAYKQLRVSFLIQADKPEDVDPRDKKTIKTNKALSDSVKTTINFFIDSRYYYNSDKTKVQVIDKYGRTAWVTIDQCKNHQIPIYKNGPARIDADYRPAFRGEEELTSFILNYLNVTSIESYNKNTGQWVMNAHPEDCEGRLEHIKDYFKGDISELKEYCTYMPDNRVKILLGVRTDNEGRQFNTAYTRLTLRNGTESYISLFDKIAGSSNNDTVYSNDPAGVISNIREYDEDVKETDLSAPASSKDPFAEAAALPESDLPFEAADDLDPFAGAA